MANSLLPVLFRAGLAPARRARARQHSASLSFPVRTPNGLALVQSAQQTTMAVLYSMSGWRRFCLFVQQALQVSFAECLAELVGQAGTASVGRAQVSEKKRERS